MMEISKTSHSTSPASSAKDVTTITARPKEESVVLEAESAASVEVRTDVATGKRKWTSYIWDTLDKDPAERRMLFKLDAALLTFASLGYFIKYLDQANINSAFVSGMKEDLGLYQNQLNIMQTCWTVGYVLGELPSNLLLTRLRPRYWLPTMELLWAVLTMCLSRASSARTVYALRFFVGLAESTFYPGMQYLIGSWYRSDELAKRSCIFHTSSAIATMFSGYLMAAVYRLDGTGGFRGWQWLFLVDGIISLPVALAGYWILPDVPEISAPFYLTTAEVQLARVRMEREGRRPRAPYTAAKLKAIFTSWRLYAFTWLYVLFNNGAGAGGQPVFAQWLKSTGRYSVSQINTYPTITSAVQVGSTLAYAWTSDAALAGARWPPILFGATANFIAYVPLAVWRIPNGLRWTCYALIGCGGGLSGLLFAWAHEACAADNEERALVVGSMNALAYAVQAWLPLLVWDQTDSPRYFKGFVTASVISVLLFGSTLVVRGKWEREKKKRKGEGEEIQDVRVVV